MVNIDNVIKQYRDKTGHNPSRLLMSRGTYLELRDTFPYSSWFCTTVYGEVFYKGIRCRIRDD